MTCAAIHTGSQFLAGTLTHLDCQGRSIGAYGYGALADPGSPVALALTAILTIFIALFGLRLLLGTRTDARDLATDAIRVGLFLALATSWPAWRTVAYDLVLDGPAQVAGSIGLASSLPGSNRDLIARLQDADDGMFSLTAFGSGRLTGGISKGADQGDAANGIALADQTALGSGRTSFLVTVIGAFGLLRLGAGVLLAIAPLMAGLMLFGGTAAVFSGWLRGLAFCALGSLAFQIIAGAELALLYPWLGDVLAQRAVNTFTPSAPTELFVLALAFAVVTAGTLFLIARVTFLPALTLRQAAQAIVPAGDARATAVGASATNEVTRDRAQTIATAVAGSMRREESGGPPRVWTGRGDPVPSGASAAGGTAASSLPATERLGSSYRRAGTRASAAGRRRDQG